MKTIKLWRTKCAKKRKGCGRWVYHNGKRELVRCKNCGNKIDVYDPHHRSVAAIIHNIE